MLETHTNAVHTQAASAIERLINNRLFQPNPQGQPQFLALKAEIGVGLQNQKFNFDPLDLDRQDEVLRVTLRGPQIDTSPALVRDHALKILAETPLKDVVSFGSEESQMAKLKAKLQGFIAKGADLPENMLAWRGFSQALKEGEHPQDHALQDIQKDNFSVNFNIRVPATKSDDNATVTGVKQVEANLRARLPEIKKVLAERIIKYSGNLNEVQKQQIVSAVSQLDIQFSANEGEYWNNLNVTILSPQQKAYRMLEAKQQETVDKPALEVTNVLSKLSKEHLGKVLGHTFLNGGETAADVFPLIAGREDMKRAIVESLTRLKAAKPELAAEADALMNDDAFKSHDWHDRDKLKQPPVVNKDPAKPGEMTIDFTLPPGQAAQVMEKLSGLGAPSPMMTVNSVQLVGVVPTQQAALLQPPNAGAVPSTLLAQLTQLQSSLNHPLTAA